MELSEKARVLGRPRASADYNYSVCVREKRAGGRESKRVRARERKREQVSRRERASE